MLSPFLVACLKLGIERENQEREDEDVGINKTVIAKRSFIYHPHHQFAQVSIMTLYHHKVEI